MPKRAQTEHVSWMADRQRDAETWEAPLSADATAWFGLDPKPVFVLDDEWVLAEANPAGRRLVEAGRIAALRGRQLVFAHADAQACFSEGLERVTSGAASRAAVVLLCDDGRWRRVEIMRAGDRPSNGVYVSIHGNPERPVDVGPLLEAFGLSAAEGKILHFLAQGLAPKRIAARLDVSPNTVRAHLRSLYVKMHVHGMNELMRECARLTA